MRALVRIPTLLLLVAATIASAGDAMPRGVMDQFRPHYEGVAAGGDFKCIRGGEHVAARYVNDEYCDCEDGSDEPGTAACTYLGDRAPSELRFQCNNDGFLKTAIFHSRVNDGICDCCDGSDEYGGLAKCGNTCAEAQAREQQAAAEREAQRQRGLLAKAALLSEASTLRLSLSSKLAEYRATLATVDADIADAEKEKIAAEAIEQQERDAIHKASLEAKSKWDEEQAQKKAQAAAEAEKVAAVDAATNETVSEDQGAVPPNVICTKWRQTKNCKGDGVRDSDFDRECSTIIESGASGFCDCIDTRTGLDVQYPFDCGHRRLTCEKMCEAEGKDIGFWADDAPVPPAEPQFTVDTGANHQTPAATDARNRHNELLRKKQEANGGISDVEQQLGDFYGPEGVFLPLKGRCFDMSAGQYTYAICPFDKVKQGHTNMGNWKAWGEQTYGSWGSKFDYAKMIFEDGDRCWSGPARSTEVRVICGPETKITSIDEPSMCTYKMVMETPAICE